MDPELYEKSKKARAPRAQAPRIGDVRISKVALSTLRLMRDGAVVLATRRFPFEFTFQLHYPDGSRGSSPLTDALVDTLVRTRLIETDSANDADTKLYRITKRGRDALDGFGFDLVEEQLPLIEGA